jgi:carbonic anhydrase
MRKLSIAILLFVITLPCFGSSCVSDWNYVPNGPIGPEKWGTLDLDWVSCSAGRTQSPINIINMTLNNSLPLLAFSQNTSAFTVRNTGHDLKVYLNQPWTMQWRGETAKLVQFHFHTKAEHLERGHQNDGEIHFVFQLPTGKTLVVATWIIAGGANTTLAAILAAKPPVSCQLRSSTTPIGIRGLIRNWHHYATYEGSLTTPPCGENVTFVVLLEGITASTTQLAALKLVSTGNARPPQPLNGRSLQWRQMP